MSEKINATLTITNTVHNAAFGIAHAPVGANVYIPASLTSFLGDLRTGDLLEAILVPNPIEANIERTPYMAINIKPAVVMRTATESQPTAPSEPEMTIEEQARKFARETLQNGGVWTLNELFADFMGEGAAVAEHMNVYTAIDMELRSMFNADQVSKWAMWRKHGQDRASKVWFSCCPERVDVAEFE